MNINDLDIKSDEIWNLIDSLEIDDTDDTDISGIIIKCSECGSTNLYTDKIQGTVVCSECGLKNEDLLDGTPDWNSINSTIDNNSRCGCPTNYFFPRSSLGTKVKNGRFSKISMLEKWSQMPYKERSKYEVLKYIETVCKENGIIQPIIDNAKNLFNQLSKITLITKDNKIKNIIIRGLNRKSIIAACVYNGANLQGFPRTPKEIAKIFDITEKQVTKGNRKFRDIMIKESIVNNIKSSQSDEYIDRKEYIKLLNLDDKHIEIAKKIAKNIKRLDIASDHQPASIAAASVMLMGTILKLNLSKKKISETFKISQVTIIKTFRKIHHYRKVLISNTATEKILSLSNDKELIEIDSSVNISDLNDSDSISFDLSTDDKAKEKQKQSLIKNYL